MGRLGLDSKKLLAVASAILLCGTWLVVCPLVGWNAFFLSMVTVPVLIPMVCSLFYIDGGLETPIIPLAGLFTSLTGLAIYFYFSFMKAPDKYDALIVFFVPPLQLLVLTALVIVMFWSAKIWK